MEIFRNKGYTKISFLDCEGVEFFIHKPSDTIQEVIEFLPTDGDIRLSRRNVDEILPFLTKFIHTGELVGSADAKEMPDVLLGVDLDGNGSTWGWRRNLNSVELYKRLEGERWKFVVTIEENTISDLWGIVLDIKRQFFEKRPF